MSPRVEHVATTNTGNKIISYAQKQSTSTTGEQLVTGFTQVTAIGMISMPKSQKNDPAMLCRK